MKKVFLFVHNAGTEKRDYLARVLDQIPEIDTWRYDMTNCFYLVSESDATTIGSRIREKTTTALGAAAARFIVAEIGDYWGYATEETWYLLANKRHKT